MGRPGRRKVNPGWFRAGPDSRRHDFTPEERIRGGIQAYGRLLMERPKAAWWVLNTRIRKQARAARDEALREIIERSRT